MAETIDVISIRIHVNELKAQFDNAMRDGDEFTDLRKIYMEIKELECHLKVIEWDADKTRSAHQNSYRIDKPKPLL